MERLGEQVDEEVRFGIFSPRLLIRIEGAAAFVLGVLFYGRLDESWWLFVLLILVPDLSIPVYLLNKRVGAAAYNAVHTYIWAAVLAAYGTAADRALLTSLAVIWVAHLGLDRLLGFGLKYPTGFKDTHLQRI